MYTFAGTTSYKITSYSITSANDFQLRDPRDWMLQGCTGSCTPSSDTGWVTLDTRTAQWFPSRYQTKTFAFTNVTAYRQIRLRITSNYNDPVTQVSEFRLFDTGGCTPQSDTALCASYGKNCGGLTADDSCGATRSVTNCGTCAGTTCAGGGIPNVCGSGAAAGTCPVAYAQANCQNYMEGQSQVSSGGRTYLCANGNCRNCAISTSCAPGASGCPWGVVWQDNGACGAGGGGAGTCKAAYAMSACLSYATGTQVSSGGRNYTCANGNCTQCGGYTTCAPGQTGCPWGAVWTDNGTCS
jgi:hypothetical protein